MEAQKLTEVSFITEDNVARVYDLKACMESGDEAGAKEVLDELANVRESTLYQEVGKLTRELHDALSNFGVDEHMATLAKEDIPDARERLNYVITMTDDAATRTLNAVEESIPLCEGLEQRASELLKDWTRFTKREMDANEFRELSKQMSEFLQDNSTGAVKINENLKKVLMAQDFQDLTSQIIKRVIKLVEDVEGNLVNLITLIGASKLTKDPEEHHKPELSGPVVPGLDDAGSVSGQDEVDDLLSSLGF